MKNIFLLPILIGGLLAILCPPNAFSQCEFNEATVNIEIQLDDFGEETVWQIYDVANGNPVAFGGPYPDEGGQIVNETVCLVQACYDIVFFDSAGDGFCCDFGNGGFVVSIPGQNLLVEDGDFFDNKVETFCIGLNVGGAGCNLDINIEPIAASCGTEDGEVILTGLGGNGNYQYRTELSAWSSLNTIDDLPVGTHEAWVRNANGTCITGPLLFETIEDCINQPCTENLVNLNIQMDDFPSEVVWQLFINDSTSTFEGGPYPIGTNIVDKNMCLPDGCYTLVVSDIEQNGICCESGNGSISVTSNGVLIGSSNGLYADGEVITFCVGNNQQPLMGVVFSGRALLQGALLNTPIPGLMRDDLRVQNLIPLQEPYSNLPNFQHIGGGGESIPSAALDFENEAFSIVDWGFIDIRSATNPSQVIATQSVLISKNGVLTDTDGIEFIFFPNLSPGKYYVAFRHRNHIGVMLQEPLGLGIVPVSIDFASKETSVWGNNARIDMGSGLMALWAGNCNLSNDIIFQGNNNDPNNIFFEVLGIPDNAGFQANYIHSAYSANDVNMDGQIIYQGNNNDSNFIFFNVLGANGNDSFSSNYIISEQIP